MLHQLPRTPGRQQRLPLTLPRVTDRVTAGNSLPVASLGLLEKITHRKSPQTIFAKAELAGYPLDVATIGYPPPGLTMRFSACSRVAARVFSVDVAACEWATVGASDNMTHDERVIVPRG
jgi:hypothetical protein